MPKEKTKPVGRPASPFPLRTPIRHDEKLIKLWRIGAARSGLALQDWIRTILTSEATRSFHVPPLGGRRRG